MSFHVHLWPWLFWASSYETRTCPFMCTFDPGYSGPAAVRPIHVLSSAPLTLATLGLQLWDLYMPFQVHFWPWLFWASSCQTCTCPFKCTFDPGYSGPEAVRLLHALSSALLILAILGPQLWDLYMSFHVHFWPWLILASSCETRTCKCKYLLNKVK